jgi:hypothetical protein
MFLYDLGNVRFHISDKAMSVTPLGYMLTVTNGAAICPKMRVGIGMRQA